MWSVIKKQKHTDCDQVGALMRQEWITIIQDLGQKPISSIPLSPEEEEETYCSEDTEMCQNE